MQAAQQLATKELRRSARLAKQVSILLIGMDAEGKDFVEETKTVLLSRHGAGVVSRHKLCVEQELILVRPERNNAECEVRVVGQIGFEDGSYTYGVAFVDPDVDFWSMGSPLADDSEFLELQCGTCGLREFVNQGTLEADVYAIHDGLLRDCKRCHRSTFWRQAPPEEKVTVAPPQAGSALPEPASGPGPEARSSPEPYAKVRAHVRIKVNFTGCVRNNGADDNLVFCENISRGGLCFKSKKRFFETAQVEVAAPYTPGSPCILMPAKIVYVQELPEEGMYRCGVQYLHLTRDPRA